MDNMNKEEVPSKRALEARQKNILTMLEALAENKRTEADKGYAMKQGQEQEQFAQTLHPQEQAARKEPGKKAVKKVKHDIKMPRSPEEAQAIAFDENGNFRPPSVVGYWKMVLENINSSDPTKKGKDWRDDAIAKFNEAEKALEQAEASMHGRA